MEVITGGKDAPLSISKNMSWNFAGKIAYAGSRAFLLILIAKLCSVEIVGQYSLAFSIATPIFMLTDFDLRSIITTDVKKEYTFGHYFGMRLVSTLLAMMAMCVISAMQDSLQLSLVIIMIGISKSFEAISDLFYGVMQRQERLDKLGISLIIKSTLSMLMAGLLLWRFDSIVLATAGMAAAYLIVLIAYDMPAASAFTRLQVNFEPKVLWKLFRLSLPMGFVLLFISLNGNISAYFVKAYLDSHSLGYFVSIVYILTVGNMVVSGIGQTMTARMSRYFEQGDIGSFRKIMRHMVLAVLGIGAAMAAGAALFGDFALTLLYNSEYSAYQPLFVLIMVVAGISYAAEIVRVSITAARQFKLQSWVYGGVLLISCGIYPVLVPWLKLYGAAISMLIAACLQLIVNFIIAYKITAKRAALFSGSSAFSHEGV